MLGGVIFQKFSLNYPSYQLPSISPPLVFGSFPHLMKLQSRQEIRVFLSPEAAATCKPTESSVLPEFKSPPGEFFFWSGQKASPQRGEVSQLHCTLKYFFGTMALPTLKQLKRRKMVKKISQPRLGHGRAGQLVICCKRTGSSFLSHPNWQPESESSFSLRSLGDSTFQVLIFTNPQEREG